MVESVVKISVVSVIIDDDSDEAEDAKGVVDSVEISVDEVSVTVVQISVEEISVFDEGSKEVDTEKVESVVSVVISVVTSSEDEVDDSVKTVEEDISVRVLDEGSEEDIVSVEAEEVSENAVVSVVMSDVDISVEVLVMETSEVEISVDNVSVTVLDEGSEEEMEEDVKSDGDVP